MGYISNRPTKQRKRFYNFMERNKKMGSVSPRKVGRFIRRNNLNLNRNEKFYNIENKNRTPISSMVLTKNKRKVNWWVVD